MIDEALQWVNAHRNSFRYPITTVNISLSNGSNSETLPAGGGYEADLAQLAADGMFISVAAGNDFAAFGQPGLGYPAVSPNVVPVAAENTSGGIASFSQRDARVLAAPGVDILTTIPKYASGGPDDNFACCSGTSMAAPYVAGAAVLLRQAYQSVGAQNITQSMLDNEMVATADTIYDPATGQDYHSLNLHRAIDAVLASAVSPPAAQSSAGVPTTAIAASGGTGVSPVLVEATGKMPVPPDMAGVSPLLPASTGKMPVPLGVAASGGETTEPTPPALSSNTGETPAPPSPPAAARFLGRARLPASRPPCSPSVSTTLSLEVLRELLR